jgi:large subunit ribosomal protein L5
MPDLQTTYLETIAPELQKQLGITNRHAVPKLVKVVINVGVGQAVRDRAALDNALATLSKITGQKPVATKARESISNFKIRQGMEIGAVVTLRGKKMYDFMDKLINITFPRVRDFRGIDAKFDGQGNCSIGFSEHLAFPEVSADEVERVHGLQITMVTSTTDDKAARALLTAMKFPFKK